MWIVSNNVFTLWFSLDDKKLDVLIDYIILEPSLSDDYKRCFTYLSSPFTQFRYPFVVSQMLTTDCKYVFDKLLCKERNYAHLLKIFDYFFKAGTNPTLGGYVNKVISFLLAKKPLEVWKGIYNIVNVDASFL